MSCFPSLVFGQSESALHVGAHLPPLGVFAQTQVAPLGQLVLQSASALHVLPAPPPLEPPDDVAPLDVPPLDVPPLEVPPLDEPPPCLGAQNPSLLQSSCLPSLVVQQSSSDLQPGRHLLPLGVVPHMHALACLGHLPSQSLLVLHVVAPPPEDVPPDAPPDDVPPDEPPEDVPPPGLVHLPLLQNSPDGQSLCDWHLPSLLPPGVVHLPLKQNSLAGHSALVLHPPALEPASFKPPLELPSSVEPPSAVALDSVPGASPVVDASQPHRDRLATASIVARRKQSFRFGAVIVVVPRYCDWGVVVWLL